MYIQKLGQSILETTQDKFHPHFTTSHETTKKKKKKKPKKTTHTHKQTNKQQSGQGKLVGWGVESSVNSDFHCE